MHYTVIPSDDGKYVIVSVTGEVTTETAREYTVAANERASEWKLRNFLIDLRDAVNTQSTLTNYEYAYEEMPKQNLSTTARVALLVAPEDHSHDFIELVSRNAGYNVRLFRNADQAVAWLQKIAAVAP